MKTTEKSESKNQNGRDTDSKEESFLQGYPLSPSGEDIYNNFFEEKEINPENTEEMKESGRKFKTVADRRKDHDNSSLDDLDIPGSELDDNQEEIGSEDEENNYYSLGGDKNSDLEEDQGE